MSTCAEDTEFALELQKQVRTGTAHFLGRDVNRLLKLAGYPSQWRHSYPPTELAKNTGGPMMGSLCEDALKRLAKSHLWRY